MQCLLEIPSSSAAQQQATLCPLSAGSRMDKTSMESIALEAFG